MQSNNYEKDELGRTPTSLTQQEYQARAEDFKYGFFHPWMLLILSIILMVIVALTINRRLYYRPLVYMFFFTPMALFWAIPSSGLLISLLAFNIKGVASFAYRSQRFRLCYNVNKINRTVILTASILVVLSIIGMAIWYSSGISGAWEGPWEQIVFNTDDPKVETYYHELRWVLNAHRCPRCGSRLIKPIPEHENGWLSIMVYDECDEFFGGCCNVDINPLHECQSCHLIFRFEKDREFYIPSRRG